MSDSEYSEIKDNVVSDSSQTDSESHVSSNESPPHRNAAGHRRRVFIEDSDDDSSRAPVNESTDESDIEERAFSPRTRMSMTGIRPADLSDDSSEIEYADETPPSKSYIAQSDEEAQEINTMQQQNNSIPKEYTNENNSYVSPSRIATNQSPVITESSENDASPTVNKSGGSDEFFSPQVGKRYTTHFLTNLSDKLSSTFLESTPEAEPKSKIPQEDSDVLVISNKTGPIEISSSSDDTNNKENVALLSLTQNSAKKEKSKQKTFVQPTIPTVIRNMQTTKSTLTPAKLETCPQYVSVEFYQKEVNKLLDLKEELLKAENVYSSLAHNLPDKGLRLQKRIAQLQIDVEKKQNYLNDLHKMKPPNPVQEVKEVPKSTAPDWGELSAAVNKIKPTHTGARGLATFNNQKIMTVDRLKNLHGSLATCPDEKVLADDPQGLKVPLMEHQRHALAWIEWREKQKPRGGILADDMGLGKTLTMIAAVLAHKIRSDEVGADGDQSSGKSSSDEAENGPPKNWCSKGRRDYYHGGTLVVCPASLIRQWESEVDTKVSRHKLTVCVHHGNNRDTKARHLRTYDIVITTYNIVAREQKTNGAIFGIKWQRVILDEAHVVRNHKSQSSLAVCGLRAKYRWALTGTPIQNKELDVYALLKFLRCTPFDELAHWKRWIDNKSAGGQQRLETVMKSLLLRRTKAILQEAGKLQMLPDKKIKLVEVRLDKDEMNVYQMIMGYSRSLFAQFLNQRAERNTDLNYRAGADRPTFLQTKGPNDAYYKLHQKFARLQQNHKEVKSHEILVLLLRLRQICCHPGLIDAMLEDGDGQRIDSSTDETRDDIDLLEQLNKLNISEGTAGAAALQNSKERPNNAEEDRISRATAKVLQRSNPVFDLKRPSTKMQSVLDTIRGIITTSRDKVIIVSQWRSVLDILKTHLRAADCRTLSLDGTIPVKNRQDIVNDFNDPKSANRVLLLSLTAGGVGLNLVGANHLLMIDLHWNPQLETQAQDRIYRVGQKKDVLIYKFMCVDTVEERIKALQERKLQLANNVLTGMRSNSGTKLTIDDLKGLFDL